MKFSKILIYTIVYLLVCGCQKSRNYNNEDMLSVRIKPCTHGNAWRGLLDGEIHKEQGIWFAYNSKGTFGRSLEIQLDDDAIKGYNSSLLFVSNERVKTLYADLKKIQESLNSNNFGEAKKLATKSLEYNFFWDLDWIKNSK